MVTAEWKAESRVETLASVFVLEEALVAVASLQVVAVSSAAVASALREEKEDLLHV